MYGQLLRLSITVPASSFLFVGTEPHVDTFFDIKFCRSDHTLTNFDPRSNLVYNLIRCCNWIVYIEGFQTIANMPQSDIRIRRYRTYCLIAMASANLRCFPNSKRLSYNSTRLWCIKEDGINEGEITNQSLGQIVSRKKTTKRQNKNKTNKKTKERAILRQTLDLNDLGERERLDSESQSRRKTNWIEDTDWGMQFGCIYENRASRGFQWRVNHANLILDWKDMSFGRKCLINRSGSS